MLYAATLKTAGRIYDIPEYNKSGKKIKETIIKQSFNGEFFIDNAIRKDGELEITKNCSEVCQYYAFFFNVVSPETHEKLWNTMKDKFGPKRDATKVYPEVFIANAFIGNYLRMELLSRYNSAPMILNETKDYFLYMANRTGTLWEFIDTRASCNHGFASHICHIFYRDILGIEKIDYQSKEITIKFSDMPLNWCEGRIPIGKDFIYLKWWKEDNILKYKLSVPSGSIITIKPCKELEIAQIP
jgi:alpha-L-rhamnosidase